MSNLVLESISLWLTRIVPVLFPFMVMQSCLHILQLDNLLAKILHPVLGNIYHVSRYGTYCILAGFLFGFPMGAKITSQYYKENLISKEEANHLLGFCNNFSPAYYIGFIYPSILRFMPQIAVECIMLLYIGPLLFGFATKYFYKPLLSKDKNNKEISCACEKINFSSFFKQLQLANLEHIKSLVMIGTQMIICNILRYTTFLLPIQKEYQKLTGSFFEITIGLPVIYESSIISNSQKIYGMFLLISMGGISGILQSLSFITDAGLSVSVFLKNKILLTCFTIFLLFLLFQIKN